MLLARHLGDTAFNLLCYLFCMKRLQIDWTMKRISWYLICLFAAFVIFSSITVITGAISFWTIKSEEIVSLLTDNNYGIKNYCDYPMQIYGKGMRVLLTFVIPYAFTGYYPAAMLLGKVVPYSHIFCWPPVIALLMGSASYSLWHMGLKRYHSTGA